MELIDWKGVYSKQPPPFGHGLKQYYAVDPELLYLNNGSFGAPPKPVLQASYQLTQKIERNPDLFHRAVYQPLLINVRQKLADLLKVKLDEVVLVTNASMGANTVLRNFHWEKGDILFAFTTTFNSVARAAQYISDTPPHPTLVVIPLNFPTTRSQIIAAFETALSSNPLPPNKKRVAIIDGMVSNPGVLMPWREMVKICKRQGVWSVVDGAHSIGQEVGLDLTSAEPDFWLSNCHKWLSSKRTCTVLYVPERNQHIIRSSIPTSYAYKNNGRNNFVEQFEWHSTIDWTSILTIPAALEFRSWLGGEEKINAYCHDLAIKGGKILANILGTKEMDPEGEFTLNMVNVKLPLPSSLKFSPQVELLIMNKLFSDHKAYSAYFYHNNAWWTRCSAQVWNELEDFERMAKIWAQICKEVQVELSEVPAKL